MHDGGLPSSWALILYYFFSSVSTADGAFHPTRRLVEKGIRCEANDDGVLLVRRGVSTTQMMPSLFKKDWLESAGC